MAEILEKELEDFLFEMSQDINGIDHDHLCVEGKCFRQVTLGGYGIIDLVLIDFDPPSRQLLITVVELKKNSIDLKAVGQISRYIVGMKRFIGSIHSRIKYLRRFEIKVSGILIGNKYSSDDACFVVDTMPDVSSYLYNLDLSTGITIEVSNGWFCKNENFRKLSKILRSMKDDHRDYLSSWIKHVIEETT